MVCIMFDIDIAYINTYAYIHKQAYIFIVKQLNSLAKNKIL